jgi:lipopolysaccharide assembly outer membrane protein LptD (OstA)
LTVTRVKYARLSTTLLLIVCVSCILSANSFAEEEGITFQSDHQRRIREDNVQVLSGNVYIHFRDFDFYSDEARLDEAKKEFFGAGNVKIEGQDRIVYADSFWYNYDKDTFEVTKANGMIMVGGVSEPVYFVCKSIRGSLTDYKLIQSTLTTCTPDERQEYYIKAGMVKVLTDNKIILRNAVFYVEKIPIFYLPYYMFSMKETPFEVAVGKSSSEGYYVKIRYNYLYEENVMGSLIYHYMDKLGMRFGADHKYYIDGQGEGAFNFTILKQKAKKTTGDEESKGGGFDISVDARQKFRFSPELYGDISVRQDRDVDVYTGKARNNFSARFSLTDNTPSTNTSLSYNLTSQKGTQDSSSTTAQLSHRRNWKKQNLDFNTSFDYSTRNTTTEDENGSLADDLELKTTLSLGKRKDLYDWQFKIEKRSDIDGSKYIGDSNFSYFDRLPEITINLKPEFFDSSREKEPYEGKQHEGFELKRIALKGALYYQGPKDQEVQGFFGKFDTGISRDFVLSESGRITTSLDYSQLIASTGDAMYSYSPQIALRKDFSKKLKMDLSWRQGESEGRSPFRSESISGSGNSFSWNLNLQDKDWSHRWSTGYDLTNDNWQNLSYNASYKDSDWLQYSFSTNYSIEKGDFAPFNNSLNMTDNRSYDTKFTLNYDVKDNKIKSFSNDTKLMLGKDWDLEFKMQQSAGGKDSFPYLKNVFLNKRNDCTFFQFSWESSNDSFLFTYGITAYPTLSFSEGKNQRLRSNLPGFGGGGFDFSGLGVGGFGGGGGGGFGSY